MSVLTRLLALAAAVSPAFAAYQGFNYGSTFTTGAAKMQSDFEAEFKTAQGLVGAPGGGFTSARLYTMVQAGTANDPIQAIPAGIATKTTLLLGLWCSGGDAVFANELQALKTAITNWGSDFPTSVAGISVGSEDLYRISPTGIQNGENPGAAPATITGYIQQVRSVLSAAGLSVPVGHVDTWTAWVNGSNQAVIDASDFIGVDAYPYFQNTMANSISDGKSLFDAAVGATQAAVGGKPVWVTETGWPVSGKTSGQAVPSLDNAKTYWDQVGCPMFGQTNVWWYTLQDAEPDTPNPSFGIIGSTLTTTPLYDLSCNGVNTGSSSSSSGSSGSSSGTGSGSSSATASSPGGAGTTSAPTSAAQAGGSPGDRGFPSSQLSLETSTLTGGASSPSGTSSGSGSGSSSGSNSTVSSTSSPKPSTSVLTSPNNAATAAASVGAAFGAVMAAILAL